MRSRTAGIGLVVAAILVFLGLHGRGVPPVATIEPVLLWEQRAGPERSMVWAAFSPDGRRLASQSIGGELRLWEPETGVQVGTIRAPRGSSWVLAFSPDGKCLPASGKAPALLDAHTGRPVLRLQSAEASPRSFSPDGKLIVGTGKEAVVWDTSSGRILRTLGRSNDFGADAAFAPDGKTLAYGEHYTTANGREIHRTQIWDVRLGRTTHTIDGVVGDYAFSPDGRIVSAGVQGAPVVRMWDAQTGKRLRAFVDWRKIGWPCVVDFSPDGKLIAVGGTGLPWTPRSPFPWSRPGATANRAVGGAVTLSDARTGQIVWQTKVSHMDRVLSVDFSPDGKLLAAGIAWDAKVMVWRIR